MLAGSTLSVAESVPVNPPLFAVTVNVRVPVPVSRVLVTMRVAIPSAGMGLGESEIWVSSSPATARPTG